MPIYDFKCRECGKVFEIFLRGTSQPARPKAASRLEPVVLQDWVKL